MKKIHKLDLILLVGIGLIAIVSAIIDIFYVVVFPVCSCASVFYVSYPLWIILLIYSSIKYKDKEEQERPQYVKLFMLFLLPVLHIAFLIVGLIIGIGLKKCFSYNLYIRWVKLESHETSLSISRYPSSSIISR